jgi:hypothetical protein
VAFSRKAYPAWGWGFPPFGREFPRIKPPFIIRRIED